MSLHRHAGPQLGQDTATCPRPMSFRSRRAKACGRVVTNRSKNPRLQQQDSGSGLEPLVSALPARPGTGPRQSLVCSPGEGSRVRHCSVTARGDQTAVGQLRGVEHDCRHVTDHVVDTGPNTVRSTRVCGGRSAARRSRRDSE